MLTNSFRETTYIEGGATAALGSIGSFITVLFYCQAIKSLPKKINLLYKACFNLIKDKTNLGINSSKAFAGFLALIATASLGYLGYYSMTGFYIAVLTAFQCTPNPGELCWLTNSLELSSLWVEALARFQQAATGMINTSALVPAITKLLNKLNSTNKIEHKVQLTNSPPTQTISHFGLFSCCNTSQEDTEHTLLLDAEVSM